MRKSGSDLPRYPRRRNPPSEEKVFQPNGSVTPTRPAWTHRLTRLCLRPTSRRCGCLFRIERETNSQISLAAREGLVSSARRRTSTVSAPNTPTIGSTVPERAGLIVHSRSRHCCECRTRRHQAGGFLHHAYGCFDRLERARQVRRQAVRHQADRAPRLPALAPELPHSRALPPPAPVGAVQGQLAIGPCHGHSGALA